MFNLFKMHLYRASRAMSTIVLSIVLGATMLLTFGLAFIIYDDPFKLGISAAMTGDGLSLSGSFALTPATVHTFFIQGNDAFIILLTIFAVIFVNCDYARGFIKNTYNMFEEKWKFIFSKWTALIACVSCVYVLTSAIGLGLGALLKSFTPGHWDDYLRVFLVDYLCLVAMITLVYLITSLFKSPAGGMVIGLLMATGIAQTIEHIFDVIIAKICGASSIELLATFMGVSGDGIRKFFRISDYCLDNVYLTYSASADTTATIRAVCVAVGYAAVALGLTMFLSRKKDIR